MTIDATRIIPKLYMGGEPPRGPEVHAAGFDVIVLCAWELQFPVTHFPGVEVISLPLEDDSSKPLDPRDWEAIVRVSRRVARRVTSGRRTLVTCAMGLNRSGVVTAAIIHYATGVSGLEAATHVQRKRRVGETQALYNKAFVKALTARLPARRAGAVPA